MIFTFDVSSFVRKFYYAIISKFALHLNIAQCVQNDKPASVPAAVYHGEGEALVGRSIVKKFKRTKYAGKVTSFDAELKWYKVNVSTALEFLFDLSNI